MNTTKKKIERCVICGPKQENEDVAHFNFPKNKYHEWKTYCLEINSDKIIFSSSKLCCIHFSPDCFSSVSTRHILKKNAIPSLNPKNQGNNVRRCNHNLSQPRTKLKTIKRSYGLHQGLRYCLLCRSMKAAVASFSFPKDEIRRQQWLEFCGVKDDKINSGSRLCQHHFTDDDLIVSNSGRFSLKNGASPSIRLLNAEKLHGNEVVESNCFEEFHGTDCDENINDSNRNENFHDAICYVNVDIGDIDYGIPPKISRLSDESRFDDPINVHAISSEANDTSSTREHLEFGECSFCKISTVDLVQFRFSNNSDMRLFLTAKCGLSVVFLDTIHNVCISHFDSSDMDVNKYGEKSVKDGALPWSYLSHIIDNCAENNSSSPIANSSREVPATSEIVTPVMRVKRKSYVGDMTPSDFKTPRRAQRNLGFIKNKFKDVSVKVKQLQDKNHWANQRVKKVLDTLQTLKTNGLLSNNVVTTVNQFTENYVGTVSDV